MAYQASALAEGLYWYAEKLMWGFEDVERDPAAAFKLYRQAAGLGSSDAHLRIGELYEYGKGVERDAAAALASYRKAIAAGNFIGLGYMARLLSRSAHADRAEGVWDRFFAALADAPDHRSSAASIGEVLHWYIDSRLRHGLEPKHVGTLQRHLTAIVAHHQALLEHATGDEQLSRLDAVSTWMKARLRPSG